jgi:hypothetical protein
MKRLVVILLLAIGLGVGAYLISYSIARSTFCHMPGSDDPANWVRQEFQLDDAQYARVKQLDDAYYPQCAAMCGRIEQSRGALKSLMMSSPAMTPEIGAALKSDGELRGECRAAMLRHFYEVSQAMPPAEGKRYLLIMQEQVLDPMPMGSMPDTPR